MKVVLITGYYDAFSGYQEVVLARAFAKSHQVTVVAGDRVSPIFTDEALHSLRIARRYPKGYSRDGEVSVIRVSTVPLSSLIIPLGMSKALRSQEPDLVIILAVGQGFGALAATRPQGPPRVAIFGDNYGQWAQLSKRKQKLKAFVFGQTKGKLYRHVMRNSVLSYGNTPDTCTRLERFAARDGIRYLPLSIDSTNFYPDEADRNLARTRMNIAPEELLVSLAGKAAPEKAWEDVLDALERVGASYPWRLFMPGLPDNSFARSLRNRVAGSTLLRDRTVVEGYLGQDQVISSMRAADVCVWPRFPAITIQQAMATGCRVMVPATTLTGHLIEEPSQGVTFEPGNVTELSLALKAEFRIRNSSADRSLRAQLAQAQSADGVVDRIIREAGVGP